MYPYLYAVQNFKYVVVIYVVFVNYDFYVFILVNLTGQISCLMGPNLTSGHFL